MKRLVILESPGKIKKVSHYLKENDKNNNYIVKASIGHFRKIPNTEIDNLGIDLKTMKAFYQIDSSKKQVVNELIKFAKEADEVILATDPDREGEAIAWHLYETLKPYNKNFKRMRLNSITSFCVKSQLSNLGTIDENYANSAITRQLIDRILGYLISDNVRKNCGVLSAGRVQSASLRILADRQIDINNYIQKTWFSIYDTIFGVIFKNYIFSNDKLISNKFETSNDANNVVKNMNNIYTIKKITKIGFTDKQLVPFSTVDLLKTSGSLLKFKTKETQELAQSLYEKGWITYIRTDSNIMDETTIENLNNYVSIHFDKSIIGTLKTIKAKDTDQEGHPAIVPTHFERDKEYIELNKNTEEVKELSEKEIKLYMLIWYNTICSIIKPPTGSKITYILENKNKGQTLFFISEFKEYNFNGYYGIHEYLKMDINTGLEKFTNLNNGDIINVNKVEISKENDNPPSLYNEVSLIDQLQKKEIGRPSTYKYAVEANILRGYVDIVDKKIGSMKVNNDGMLLDQYLRENFANVINLIYTKEMESDLDLIASGKLIDTKEYLQKFYNLIKKLCLSAKKVNEIVECSLCNSVMILRTSKNGKFYGCSDYPKCNNVVNIINENDKKEKCNNCKSGVLIKRKRKDGKFFYGCSNYPKCRNGKNIISKSKKKKK